MDGGEPPTRCQVIGSAVRIEHVELCRGEHQAAVLVLPVEGEQLAAELAQVGDRRRAPADVGSRPSVGPHATREHDLVAVGGEPFGERRLEHGRALEYALDVRLRGAGSHDCGPRAAAEQKVERVGEHRLAGTGLAGEDVQPRSKAELGPLDQEQVLDTKLVQHLRGCTSRRRRTRWTRVT